MPTSPDWRCFCRAGGLYVDCHCAIADIDGLRALLAGLDQLDLVVIRRNPASFADPSAAHPPTLMNGVMAARSGSPLVADILQIALENLERHLYDQHASDAFLPYDLWSMLGAWVVTNTVLEAAADYRQFRKEAKGRVRVMAQESCPIRVGAHPRRYNQVPAAGKAAAGRPSTRHWSQVQQAEPLFDPAALPALMAARIGRPRPGFSDPADLPGAPSAP